MNMIEHKVIFHVTLEQEARIKGIADKLDKPIDRTFSLMMLAGSTIDINDKIINWESFLESRRCYNCIKYGVGGICIDGEWQGEIATQGFCEGWKWKGKQNEKTE